jgi:hypothetical protein
MMQPASAPSIATAGVFFAGFSFGLAYFVVLRRTIDLYIAGRGRLVPSLLTLGRLAAVTLFLMITARNGVLPLLASFIGFLMARAVALRAARKAT